jgi:hypothetical protein
LNRKNPASNHPGLSLTSKDATFSLNAPTPSQALSAQHTRVRELDATLQQIMSKQRTGEADARDAAKLELRVAQLEARNSLLEKEAEEMSRVVRVADSLRDERDRVVKQLETLAARQVELTDAKVKRELRKQTLRFQADQEAAEDRRKAQKDLADAKLAEEKTKLELTQKRLQASELLVEELQTRLKKIKGAQTLKSWTRSNPCNYRIYSRR